MLKEIFNVCFYFYFNAFLWAFVVKAKNNILSNNFDKMDTKEIMAVIGEGTKVKLQKM